MTPPILHHRMRDQMGLQGGTCSPSLVAGTCSTAASESSLDRQFLFSVYNHPAPGYSAHIPCARRYNVPPSASNRLATLPFGISAAGALISLHPVSEP